MINTASQQEYSLLKEYLLDECKIEISKGDEYLIRKNLSGVLTETGCETFNCFVNIIKDTDDRRYRDRIMAAMFDVDTAWFRDEECWTFLADNAIPSILAKAGYGERARIWSVATSTGQEAYSLAMLVDDIATNLEDRSAADRIEIIGTDTSAAALFLAVSAGMMFSRWSMAYLRRNAPDISRTTAGYGFSTRRYATELSSNSSISLTVLTIWVSSILSSVEISCNTFPKLTGLNLSKK